ncbi:MAG TPA: polyribonucleotide nucleotidyltransferase [Thermoanaerobaculia bacterium]|nr:polyribonucleotide nucleotidyltransferase [Thermoanaerobaculia bacterium]
MAQHQVSIPLGTGSLDVQIGKLAKQADGSAVVKYGETMVLATAVFNKEPKENADFFPLTVDYRENTYAAGRIPGGWFKREGRPTEKEILTSRLIDRPLRPLFPKGFNHETQIIAFVLSADGQNDPDVLAINAASVALTCSLVPYYSPVGAVRVGRIDGSFVANPTNSERDKSDIDLVVVGTEDAVVMVEAGAREVPEQTMIDAIFFGHEAIRRLVAGFKDLQRQGGYQKPDWQASESYPGDVFDRVRSQWGAPMMAAMTLSSKITSYSEIKAVKKAAVSMVPEAEADLRQHTARAADDLVKALTRETILAQGKRLDGRRFDQVRPITCEVGLLPRTHGSALFTRGETQALVTSTLGTADDAQIIEEYEGESEHTFLLHYNFPPFSVGETKFLRGPSRRDIGHGNLARRALAPVLPTEEAFPYTVRVVSDILESNGSSSMATVCGGTLALMDAGVPIKAPVAGVAMGLVSDGDKFAILTDIAGQEDHYGDMDFKVAGTREGITALQMDIKIKGLKREIVERALEQARVGRLYILERMSLALDRPRANISRYAPRIFTMQIPRDRIRDVIGSGGKTIRSIIEATGCKIDVEDSGKVSIASSDEAAALKAIEIIEGLTQEPEIGKVYRGKVRRVEPYGAFVEILPGQDGLVHISELAPYRVRQTTDIVKEGDEVTVKIIAVDPMGKIKLSRKQALSKEELEAEMAMAPVGAPGEDEGRDEFPRGGRGSGEHHGHPNRGRGGPRGTRH